MWPARKKHDKGLGFLSLLLTLFPVSAMGPLHVPPPGPAAQSARAVVFIASDYRNGGVMGVYRGFEEASRKLGWQGRLEDGRGFLAIQAHVGALQAVEPKCEASVWLEPQCGQATTGGALRRA